MRRTTQNSGSADLRLVVLSLVSAGALLLAACSAGDKAVSPEPQRTSTTVMQGEAATADLGPLPADLDAARSWLEANGSQVDGFMQVASEFTAPELPADCDGVAGRFYDTLGPISDYLGLVADSPDPVLAELLTSAAISARTMVAACTAGDDVVAGEERPGLTSALVLIERRQVEIRG